MLVSHPLADEEGNGMNQAQDDDFDEEKPGRTPAEEDVEERLEDLDGVIEHQQSNTDDDDIPSSPPTPPTPPLPPGVVPVSGVLPLFCIVASLGLTLLGTTFPLAGSTTAEIHNLHLALGEYVLSAVTVILYVFKMETCLELVSHLLLLDQILLFLWLLNIVICPAFLQLAIKHGTGTGSITRWTEAQTCNMLLLLNYFLLSAISLFISSSLCFHPQHQNVPSSTKVCRRRWLKIHSVGSTMIFFLVVLELLTERFNEEYMILVPIFLSLEGLIYTVISSRLKVSQEDMEEEKPALPTDSDSSHPPPPLLLRKSTTFLVLSELFALQRKRLDLLQNIFDSVCGTAMTLLGVTLLLAAGKQDEERKAFDRLAVSLFMNFWASITVVLYWSKMRRVFHFR